ncbi:MAG TPA: hypothetical protein DGG95_17580 [Cytophagales bacterium]|nr:hypothetical protein [Cytophagales bacterium]
MINVLLAIQLKPKLFMKAKRYFVFAELAKKCDQKTGFKNLPFHNLPLLDKFLMNHNSKFYFV